MLTRSIEFLTKNRSFRKFWVEKNFFSKKVLYPLLGLFISAFLRNHTYMYLYPSRRAQQNELAAPAAAAITPALLEVST